MLAGAANLDLEPLDDTRVHPESYRYALQVRKGLTDFLGGLAWAASLLMV